MTGRAVGCVPCVSSCGETDPTHGRRGRIADRDPSKTLPRRSQPAVRCSTSLETELELEFVGDRYSVRTVLRDRRLEVPTRLGDRVTMERDDLHAPSLVELQCPEIVVGGDQPKPCAAGLNRGVTEGIE